MLLFPLGGSLTIQEKASKVRFFSCKTFVMTDHDTDSLHFVILKFISYLNVAALNKHTVTFNEVQILPRKITLMNSRGLYCSNMLCFLYDYRISENYSMINRWFYFWAIP